MAPGLVDKIFARFGVQSYSKLDAATDQQDGAGGGGGSGDASNPGGHCTVSGQFKGRGEQSILSKALYLWVTPFLKLGGERTLELEDLLPLPKDYLASNNSRRFEVLLERAMRGEAAREAEEKEWEGMGKARSKPPLLPSLVWPLWSCFGSTILTGSFFKLCNDLIQFLPAVLLGGFLRYIAGKDHFLMALHASEDAYGVMYCLLMFLLPVSRTLCEQVYFYYAQASGICIKGALATAVYRKTMRLSAAGGGSRSHYLPRRHVNKSHRARHKQKTQQPQLANFPQKPETLDLHFTDPVRRLPLCSVARDPSSQAATAAPRGRC